MLVFGKQDTKRTRFFEKAPIIFLCFFVTPLPKRTHCSLSIKVTPIADLPSICQYFPKILIFFNPDFPEILKISQNPEFGKITREFAKSLQIWQFSFGFWKDN